MAAAMMGIFAHPSAAHAATPMDSSSKSSNSSGGDPATISANDFLTLLVTEMQNQDPTATTDPNEYINQLVQVNSLEQLVGINQTLTTAFGPASGSSTGNSSASPATSIESSLSNSAFTSIAARPSAQHAPGNLSTPQASAAAQRVAHALDGHLKGSSVNGHPHNFRGTEPPPLRGRL